MTAVATLPVLLQEGDHASRPAASAVGSGALYSCTTHSLIYQTDGSTWTTWATLGGGTPDLDAVIAVSGGQDISDALSGAAAPDAGNVFATMADVGGGGSGLVLLEQHTATNTATLDFTSFISSTYDEYLFELVTLVPATDNVNMWMRMGTGGGPTYDAGTNYPFSSFRWSNTGSAVAGATPGSPSNQLGLDGLGGVDNGSNFGFWGDIRLFNPQAGGPYPKVGGHFGYVDNAGSPISCSIFGQYQSTTVVTAVRFMFSSGNISTGTIRAYGIAK